MINITKENINRLAVLPAFNIQKKTILNYKKEVFYMAYYQPPIYGNGYYNQLPQQSYYQQTMLPTQMSVTNQQSQQVLNGRLVESEDIVKTIEVPFGGYGIFPKADMSSIYIKQWNSDGTTKITSYIPYVETKEEPKEETEFDKIQKSIAELSKKIDNIKIQTYAPSTPMKRRKENEDVD